MWLYVPTDSPVRSFLGYIPKRHHECGPNSPTSRKWKQNRKAKRLEGWCKRASCSHDRVAMYCILRFVQGLCQDSFVPFRGMYYSPVSVTCRVLTLHQPQVQVPALNRISYKRETAYHDANAFVKKLLKSCKPSRYFSATCSFSKLVSASSPVPRLPIQP
jgi:hypothetical protein